MSPPSKPLKTPAFSVLLKLTSLSGFPLLNLSVTAKYTLAPFQSNDDGVVVFCDAQLAKKANAEAKTIFFIKNLII